MTTPVSHGSSAPVLDPSSWWPEVTLVIVTCGQQRNVVPNTIHLVKSAILFSQGVSLKVILFRDSEANKNADESMEEKLQKYTKIAQDLGFSFKFEVHDTTFPENDDGVDWRNMFRACATQRLFLPTLLPDTDALIYMDTDTIFLSSVKETWDHFGQMEKEQVMGMVAEQEPSGGSSYTTNSKLPYYGPTGLNSGVVLMNLTRLRSRHFQDEIGKIEKEYRQTLLFGDQDLLNIYFSKHPQFMYDIPCSFNYRQGHCLCLYPPPNETREDSPRKCGCDDAEQNGVAIAHGNVDGFGRFPLATIHQHFSKFNLVRDNPTDLVEAIETGWRTPRVNSSIDGIKNTCDHPDIYGGLLKRFKNYLNRLRSNQ